MIKTSASPTSHPIKASTSIVEAFIVCFCPQIVRKCHINIKKGRFIPLDKATFMQLKY